MNAGRTGSSEIVYFELTDLRLHKRAFRFGSWLCENAKTLNRDRRSYSSKTVLVAHRASGFNLEIELKNIILRRVSIFEFLTRSGHNREWQAAQKSRVPYQ